MAAQLKMMPYKLLDKLIKLANDNWSDVNASKIYNLIIEELDEINEKLHKEGLKLEDQK